MWTDADRRERRHRAARADQRDDFQRDRDRILYASAFRRLSGITQIVRVGESDVFHTRQQHTLKVAQVGRRLAEKCRREQPALSEALGVHPEVVEAACLAHDLGHPPFGHVGEDVIHEKVMQLGQCDGFEGNAQSFRILTKLAVRFDAVLGLDLTRATLAAVLKYPWLRDTGVLEQSKKWNAYNSEEDDLRFARQFFEGAERSAEAALMDWADDVAYSVHDLEDFHRCGAIPWRRILNGDDSEQIISRAVANWFGRPVDAAGRLREALRNLEDFLDGGFAALLDQPYEGTRRQRQELRTMTSQLIGRYIMAAKLQEPQKGRELVHIEREESDEVRILKQITRDYIINNPSLAAQQKGQKRVLEGLVDDLASDTKAAPPNYLPKRLIYLWDIAEGQVARFAADCVASLTEAEALGLYARLHGVSSASVLDPIVR